MSRERYVNREAAAKSGEEVRFSFGANWVRFSALIDRERLETARESLRQFTGRESFEGCVFVDAGSGSGLFSLAAWSLGARRVVSFDVDPSSIEATRGCRAQAGSPANWWIVQGSVLAPPFRADALGADILYSWGVVHHTGAMYDAIARLSPLVRRGGSFYLAIYNRTRSAPFWLRVKRLYNRAPALVRRGMEIGYVGAWAVVNAARGRNPVRRAREYQRRRGMSMMRDVEDWLGGLPYEFASPAEVTDRLASSGFTLTNSRTTRTVGCNEFLFERRAD